jgi:hypothetical protein
VVAHGILLVRLFAAARSAIDNPLSQEILSEARVRSSNLSPFELPEDDIRALEYSLRGEVALLTYK